MRLRDGSITLDPRLDRIASYRTDHLEKYPLTAATMPSAATPVQAGFNVYRWLMHPTWENINGRERWVIGRADPARWGGVVGGHAVALKPHDVTDTTGWWGYYNQGQEGRCPEFSLLRVLTLLNRKRYDITSRWHYWQMQREDEWAGGSYPGASPEYEGSSVRAALEIARKYGAIPARPRGATIAPVEAGGRVRPTDGIAAYRWCPTWDDVRAVLQVPDDEPGVPMLNSWGEDYPHEVLLLDEAGSRLLAEDGEFGVVTDR